MGELKIENPIKREDPEAVEKKGKIKEGKRRIRIKIIRHGKALYGMDWGIIQSDNPESKPEAKNQWFYSDLTPEGKRLVREEAIKFLDTLDKKTDALFFVSSDLVRAAETAKIFLDVARERHFDIITPRITENEDDEYLTKAEEIGEGCIRKIDCLTLDHLENMLQEAIFNPDDFMKTMVQHPENISPETKDRWEKARAIVDADNKGNWGDNYFAHWEKIAQFFPDIKSPRAVYDTKFKQMIRLVRFADRKMKEKNPEKNVTVLGFSHENSFIYFLNKVFGESIKNCESVGFELVESEDDESDEKPQVMIEAKGERKNWEEIKKYIESDQG